MSARDELPTIEQTIASGETVTVRLCGCDVRWPCQCAKDRIQPDGSFLQMCRCCRLEFAGQRWDAMHRWHEHIRTPEHEATARVELPRIHREDAERERQITGQLW